MLDGLRQHLEGLNIPVFSFHCNTSSQDVSIKTTTPDISSGRDALRLAAFDDCFVCSTRLVILHIVHLQVHLVKGINETR